MDMKKFNKVDRFLRRYCFSILVPASVPNKPIATELVRVGVLCIAVWQANRSEQRRLVRLVNRYSFTTQKLQYSLNILQNFIVLLSLHVNIKYEVCSAIYSLIPKSIIFWKDYRER